jgi:hypothetical protein
MIGAPVARDFATWEKGNEGSADEAFSEPDGHKYA